MDEGTRRVDPGRLVVIALFMVTMTSAAGRGLGLLAGSASRPVAQTVVELTSTALTLAFCVLVVWAYLRRGPAVATDRGWSAWVAAPLATCLPFVIPSLPQNIGGPLRSAAALVLILGGTAFSIWSVRHLSTCLSVVPQARGLVDTGPYRWIRHPLYLGEIVTMIGFGVRAGHWAVATIVVLTLVLQLYRARREETLLTTSIPGYEQYRARTWRIVPGLP